MALSKLKMPLPFGGQFQVFRSSDGTWTADDGKVRKLYIGKPKTFRGLRAILGPYAVFIGWAE